MYLTRAFINPRRRGALRFIGGPQRIHAAVMQAFPMDPPTEGSVGPRVLWRLDEDDHRRPVLWVVSPDKPDLHHVVEPYGWPASDQAFETRDYTPLLRRLESGQRYVFRTTVNPVKSTPVPPEDREPGEDGLKKRGHLVPIVGAGHQIAWFAERAGKWGFELLPSTVPMPETESEGDTADAPVAPPAYACEIRAQKNLRFWRGESGSKPVTLSTVAMEGLLRVTDADLLRNALTRGIGRAKGYGCGLISLAPAR
ncbi:type I-E CRISPR-associated protein Cas6/Cse3/CasE [Streptomonospora nanhaiensis]|uniref:CRISPR system Cascade subunit CasE n=1 Tax=Streptomonospora nanhaiensis TaxID=1323731 RepID=A0A853BLR7_9ACTN|nr:type I-E CRISPR-associated protein Cas6/Cse3/CasE [Streptomonospora nanhaiensis]MBV2365712.1 type I-E CRISPR-associated protein Cas6/Cse3/CasE [Streptomonospora nanhaiensis]NYI96509.1 CRISPR system Cascade subunit CasE [Streptomonospora nanhaiensis]